MAAETILDLEDLARRYDTHVLREYLLEQEEPRELVAARRAGELAEEVLEIDMQAVLDVADLRPRCFRRLRVLLLVNFVAYWAGVAYIGYACHLRVLEVGLQAMPPLDAGLLGVFLLGTQATVEFAVSACLTRQTRASDSRSLGLRTWDAAAWLTGLGARAAVLLDVICLPLMHKGSLLLFFLSAGTFTFAIGLFVFVVQLRLLCGLFWSRDQFSYDKPDLFFKGRDAHGMLEGPPILALAPTATSTARAEPGIEGGVRGDETPPVNAIKAAGCAHFSDLSMLHVVITRMHIPLSCQETQEFVLSISSFSRCFCEDVVQCSVKFFFLMDCKLNWLVFLSLLISAAQAVGSCFYASTSSMDLRATEDRGE